MTAAAVLLLCLVACDDGKPDDVAIPWGDSVPCVVSPDGTWGWVTVSVPPDGAVVAVEVCAPAGAGDTAGSICRESADWWMDGSALIIGDCDEPEGWASVVYTL